MSLSEQKVFFVRIGEDAVTLRDRACRWAWENDSIVDKVENIGNDSMVRLTYHKKPVASESKSASSVASASTGTSEPLSH